MISKRRYRYSSCPCNENSIQGQNATQTFADGGITHEYNKKRVPNTDGILLQKCRIKGGADAKLGHQTHTRMTIQIQGPWLQHGFTGRQSENASEGHCDP